MIVILKLICHASEPISMLHGRSSGSLDDMILEDDTDLHKELDDFFGSEAEVSEQLLWWKKQFWKMCTGSKMHVAQIDFPIADMLLYLQSIMFRVQGVLGL